MINKDFLNIYDSWNLKKKNIECYSKEMSFNEGDVWWCSLGVNIGNESFGKGDNFRRPVLIIKKLSSCMCVALPLTSRYKIGTWFCDILINSNKRYVMLYQIRALNSKRFYVKIGRVDKEDLHKVKEKLKCLLKLF